MIHFVLFFMLAGSAAAQGCGLGLDLVTGLGVRGDEATLRDGMDPPDIVVEPGSSVELVAFWGLDMNRNGRIDGGSEWEDLSTSPSSIRSYAAKKLNELTARGGFLEPGPLLDALLGIEGGRATFRVSGDGGGSARLASYPALARLPWSPGSPSLDDYPVELGSPDTVTASMDVPPATFPPRFESATVILEDGRWIPLDPARTLEPGAVFRVLEPARLVMPGPEAWILPPDGWGTDWKIAGASTPERNVTSVMAEGWERSPRETKRVVAVGTTPVEVTVDAFACFVLQEPIEIVWKEVEYTMGSSGQERGSTFERSLQILLMISRTGRGSACGRSARRVVQPGANSATPPR